MANLRQTLEKRASVWAQMQDILAGDGDLSAEERSKWDALESELNELTADKDRLERAATFEQSFTAPAALPADVGGGERGVAVADEKAAYARAFELYVRQGREALDGEQRKLLQANFRAQGELIGSAGGYSVPEGFWNRIVETMKFYGGVIGNVEQVSTSTGNDLPWMTTDGTAEVGRLLTENTQVSTQDVTLGMTTLRAYTYSSDLVLVSLQLMQDSVVDWQAFLAARFGSRLGRIINTHLTTGDGVSKPQGLITGATTGKTTASATAITFDEVIDLEHSVDVAYRNMGGAAFMAHDLIVSALRKLKDSTGQYLWQPSLQAGTPDSLHGYPLIVNNDMDSAVTTGKKTLAFGNFRAGYVFRQVAGGQFMRLDERYADYLQVGFMSFTRIDGLVQDASAYKLLVQA